MTVNDEPLPTGIPEAEPPEGIAPEARTPEPPPEWMPEEPPLIPDPPPLIPDADPPKTEYCRPIAVLFTIVMAIVTYLADNWKVERTLHR
jgi:hypothetical protein